jgi:DNA-binding MarR family transcriptional regulator
MATPKREAVAERLHAAALHLLRRLRDVDVRAGLGSSRLSVLSVLVFGGDATIGELAAVEQVRPPTMSKLLDGLEGAGFIARTPGKDRRSVVVRATRSGRAALMKARARRLELLTHMLATALPSELDTLARAAAIIERVMDARDPGLED